MNRNIVVLYGGDSCEHDISIITAISVYNVIKWDYNAILVYMKEGKFYVGEQLDNISLYKKSLNIKLTEVFFQNGNILRKKRNKFQSQKVDCALICNHGGVGENGALAGFMEVCDIPYTCCGTVESGICMDKALTKKVLDYYNFPFLDYSIIMKNYEINELDAFTDFPYILKPATLGSSVGISVVNNKHELVEGLKLGHLFCEKVVIEKALQAFEEFNCAVMTENGNITVSAIEKPMFNNNFLNFYEKYITKTPTRELPAKINENLKRQIEDMSKAVYIQLNLSGIVRIDYLYCDDVLYINEINTVPGSLSLYLFKAKGYENIKILSFLIDESVVEYERKKSFTSQFSSSVLENFDEKQLKGGVKK